MAFDPSKLKPVGQDTVTGDVRDKLRPVGDVGQGQTSDLEQFKLTPSQTPVVTKPKSLFARAYDALGKVGGAMQSAATLPPVTRTIATANAVQRGARNLLTGNLEAEAIAQEKEMAGPLETRPVKTMTEAIGVGVQLFPIVAASSMAPLGLPMAGAMSAALGAGGKAIEKGAEPSSVVGSSLLAAPLGYAAGKLFEKLMPSSQETIDKKIREASMKIAQGKPKDLAKVQRSLASFAEDELKDVKTYSALKETIEYKNQGWMGLEDEMLEAKGGAYGYDDLGQPMKDALDDLEKLAAAIRDPKLQDRIGTWRGMLDDGSMSLKDANQVARTYGTEFGDKAFRADGTPITSVNAQAYENTRSSVKDVVRRLFGSKELESFDKAISDNIALAELAKKMEDKVFALSGRITERNIIEKAGRKLGQAVDTLTFGGPRAFVMKALFQSNIGMKQMNSLEIESLLNTNLNNVTSLMEQSDDKVAAFLADAFRKLMPMVISGVSSAVTSKTIKKKSRP